MQNIIKQAINIIENDIIEQKYSPIYIFTTENITEVIKTMNVCEKQVLTVSSSGDHIFNMLLNGASTIESYDINYFTKYYFYLKEATIRSLNYEEFLEFFFNKRFSFNSKTFSNEVFFNKILPNIKDNQAKTFWYVLFSKYDGKQLYNSRLFIGNYYPKSTYIACNDYLNTKENYTKLQQKLINYNYKFYWVNIFNDLNNLSNNKYDIIYLSNILDRLKYKNELLCVKKIKSIVESLKEHLNDNGILGMCYLYCYFDDYWLSARPGQISSSDFRLKYFKSDEYTYQPFNGVGDVKGKLLKNMDAVMLSLKKK